MNWWELTIPLGASVGCLFRWAFSFAITSWLRWTMSSRVWCSGILQTRAEPFLGIAVLWELLEVEIGGGDWGKVWAETFTCFLDASSFSSLELLNVIKFLFFIRAIYLSCRDIDDINIKYCVYDSFKYVKKNQATTKNWYALLSYRMNTDS